MPADHPMTDLYEHDIVVWADRQADLLRRLAAGERVNAEIDWDNLIEEIETVGRSEWHAVESLLARAVEHLLRLHGWPGESAGHWRVEIRVFLRDAGKRWTPSMANLIDISQLYAEARSDVSAEAGYARQARALPVTCPYSLRDLIVRGENAPDIDALLAKLAAA